MNSNSLQALELLKKQIQDERRQIELKSAELEKKDRDIEHKKQELQKMETEANGIRNHVEELKRRTLTIEQEFNHAQVELQKFMKEQKMNPLKK